MQWTYKLNKIIHNMNIMLNVEPAIGKLFQCSAFNSTFESFDHSVIIGHDWFMGAVFICNNELFSEIFRLLFFGRFSDDIKVSAFFGHLFYYQLFIESFCIHFTRQIFSKKVKPNAKPNEMAFIHFDQNKYLIIHSISMSNAHSEHVNRMSEYYYSNTNISFFFIHDYLQEVFWTHKINIFRFLPCEAWHWLYWDG